jgi:hypothetical protein
MAIKLSYDSETDVPDAHKALYTESGDKWLLTGVEGMKTQKDIDSLKEVVTKERNLRKEAEDKAKKFDKLGERDPDDVLKALDEVEELRAKIEAGEGGKVDEAALQKRVDAAVARATNPLERQLTEVTKERDTLKETSEQLGGRIRKTTLESALTEAAAGMAVRPSAVPDVLRYQDLFEIAEDGKTITTKDGVGVTPGLDPKMWLDDMKPVRDHWWADSVGGGAGGNDGKKPAGGNAFKLGSLTAVSELVRTDPEKALSQAQAAGFKTVNEAIMAMANPKKKPD